MSNEKSKEERRKLIENLTSRIDSETLLKHLEETLVQLKDRASNLVVAVQQIEGDPHAPEMEKNSLESGYDQLESLAWRIDDCEKSIKEVKDA